MTHGPGIDYVDAELNNILTDDCEPSTISAVPEILREPGTTSEGFGTYAITDEASSAY